MVLLRKDCRRGKIQISRTAKALGLGLFSLSFVLLLTACRGITSPQGWASPVFTDSSLLVSPNHTTLAHVDLAANSRAWTFPPSKSNITLTALYGTPALSQGLALVGGYNGTLYALNESDGTVKWFQATKGHIVGGPAANDSTVYVGSADRCLYAFAIASGDQQFTPFCTGQKIWSTPVVANGVVYFGSMDKKVYAIDGTTGESHWPQPFSAQGAIASTAVVDNGTVYVGGFDERMYALDASSGKERWTYKADDWIWNRALVSGGIVYFGSLSGTVYGVDATSGKLSWPKPFQGRGVVRGSPVIVGTTLVVATDQGNVYGLNATSGAQVWTAKASSGVLSDLVVNGGFVYYSTKSGQLQKVDPTNGAITSVEVPQ
jgi:outer membrane protein assembly factor BamB